MRELPSEVAIIRALADSVCKKISRKTIRYLQSLDQALLSGDDSRLTSTWEEVCVQVQYEESLFWDSYDETVKQVILGYVSSLIAYERAAVWLRTDAGCQWDEDEPADWSSDDIVNYIAANYVYFEAGRWSNPQIRWFIEQSAMRD